MDPPTKQEALEEAPSCNLCSITQEQNRSVSENNVPYESTSNDPVKLSEAFFSPQKPDTSAEKGKHVLDTEGAIHADPIVEVPSLFVKRPPKHALRMSSSGNDNIVSDLNLNLEKHQISMFSKTPFGLYLNLHDCTFQAQMARCLMTLEVNQNNVHEFWILVNGTVLRFTKLEFLLITGLKCDGDEANFEYPEGMDNRLLQTYFPGIVPVRKSDLVACFHAKRWGENDEDATKISILYFIHTFIFSQQNDVAIPPRDFHLVESGRYAEFPWGKLAFDALMKRVRQRINFNKKLYRLTGMPLALQFWFYECCSRVDPAIAVRESNLIPRILNWRVVKAEPTYKYLMQSMFSNQNSPMFYRNIIPTANELEIFSLPHQLSNDQNTSSIPDGFEDFSSTAPVHIHKKNFNENTGPSLGLPIKKARSDPVPQQCKRKTPFRCVSTTPATKDKQDSAEPIRESRLSIKRGGTNHSASAETQTKSAPQQREASSSKLNEDYISRQEFELFKISIDKHFLDLNTFLKDQFSIIMEAIRAKSDSHSKAPNTEGNQ